MVCFNYTTLYAYHILYDWYLKVAPCDPDNMLHMPENFFKKVLTC